MLRPPARFALLAPLALAAAAPVAAALPVGAPAPDFSTQAAQGGHVTRFNLSQALARGPVVLYFFPAAFTSGCTIETRAFADAIPRFRAAGATVVGVAADPIETLQRFSTEACRSRFPVAVASPQMIAAYDVRLPTAPRANRTTFVIARNGRVAWSLSDLRPDGHIEGSLAAVRRLR